MSHPKGSRVELFAAIRRDAHAGMSNRALQRKHGVGYRTVAATLNSAWPEPRKPPPRRGSQLDPYRTLIDGWLRDDLDAPRKQRHTAKRIFDRLLDEHDAVGVVSYWMVREYVATRRREIRIEAGREAEHLLNLWMLAAAPGPIRKSTRRYRATPAPASSVSTPVTIAGVHNPER